MTEAGKSAAYKVLARKYRPTRFADLIGQQALVRTLTNAMHLNRLAQAWVLTGVRGVGKTTTARIIARALNCIGPDGKGGPTTEPCGVCEHCRAIAEDRHVDVIEMDAASRTGVDDIRDLIDGVRYRPLSARYKIYIVDEVHMLSKQAFNALLKTLEEPPEHVKFVFATTEIRKVPVTVLSRCQRFDLRRVDVATLGPHLARICEAEGARLTPDAVALLARAADGSVRDGLSLLDQAIATYGGAGEIGAAALRDMLGLADRTQIFDLFEHVMGGRISSALEAFEAARQAGADPIVVLQDLLELVHWVTRVKIAPRSADDPAIPEAERVRGAKAAQELSMASLARAWQILLKALGETQSAPDPGQAADMALVRLAHAAELPSPAELVARLRDEQVPGRSPPVPLGGGPSTSPIDAKTGDGPPGAPSALAIPGALAPTAISASRMAPQGSARGPQAVAPAERQAPEIAIRPPEPKSFEEIVNLFAERREAILHAHMLADVHLVRFEPGRLEIRLGDGAPRDLANRVQKSLSDWTGRQWGVSLARDGGAPSLAEQAVSAERARRDDAATHPLVRAVFEAFPEARIVAVRDLAGHDDGPDGPDGPHTSQRDDSARAESDPSEDEAR
ncbi:MAG: DNA polymerase III subunit gamma/tau [Alphaproteobacteria bacterium]